jgi:5'-nucleotidase
MDFTAPSNSYTEEVYDKVEGLFSESPKRNTTEYATKYSKRMVEERMHKRGVMLTGRDGGA